MIKRIVTILISLIAMCLFIGCGQVGEAVDAKEGNGEENNLSEEEKYISLTSDILEIEDGFSAVRYEKDYGFDMFLANGGASSDSEVVSFLAEQILSGMDLGFLENSFGCSTIAAVNKEGEALFGRNFDWNTCEAMVVVSTPETGYASISTVNMDFITQGVSGGAVGMAIKLNEVRTLAALYASLDGMNEAGFAVSVNMIQDNATINQNTEKPDLTTTTAVRLLLNQAVDVDSALELLKQYDMHASMGMMVHFALADASGHNVVVEYIGNEMVVTETPVVTNFYLAEGEKNGIGTAQSHERYEILMDCLRQNQTMEMQDMRDALDRVSKDDFEEFASTEWSIVFNLETGIAHYYHRENYDRQYSFAIREE